MKINPHLAVILAASMAGSSGVFIHYIDLPATSISFIRTLIPVVLLGIWMAYRRIPFFRGNYKLMLGASTLNAIRLYLFFTAYIFTSIGNAVLIMYTWPVFVTLFSVLFLKEVVTKRNVLLLTLAFSGILLVYINKPFSFGDRDFIGMTAALGTAMIYAVTVVIFKKESNNYSPKEIIFYQNLVGVFVFLPFILINRPWPALPDVLIASSHAILLGMIGFSFFFYGLRHLKASTTSMLAYIEIVSALLFGIFWLKETLTWNMVMGGGIIVFTTAMLKR